jgi:23S rRNA pseudouridine955/2504/2580 synthase
MSSPADREPPHEVAEGDAGQRLDRYLRKLLPEVPLSALHRWLRQGFVRVDGKKAEPGLRLQPGTQLAFRGPAVAAAQTVQAGAEPLAREVKRERKTWTGPEPRILYRDADVLAVDKPPGLAVQPGSGPSLVDWLEARAALQPQPPSRTFHPGPAHRLDSGTSGIVLIGMSPQGLRGLNAAFAEGKVRKVYLALVRGVPSPERGTVDAPLLRLPDAGGEEPKVAVDPRGQPAITHYEVIGRRGRDAVLRVRIETGRTHQIRAHFAYLGHPLLGDRRYGGTGDRFLLHAASLELVHPVTGKPLHVTAAAPPELQISR